MYKKVKAMLIGGIAAMVMALPVAAQSSTRDLGLLISDTRTATAGIFKSDVDNYMTVDRWSSVKFDNWFSFITGSALTVNDDSKGTTNGLSGKLSVGYARNIGGIYLGAWYQGNIVQVTGGETGAKSAGWNTITQGQSSYTEYTAYNEGWVNSNNNIELLLGIAGQGIKIGFHESLYNNRHGGPVTTPGTQYNQITDYLNGTVEYRNMVDEYAEKGGWIRPYLGWGTELTVSEGIGLRPYVNFGFGVFNDSQLYKYSDYNEVHGQRENATNTLGAGFNNGYLNPYGDIGVKVDLKTKGGASATVDMKYALSINAYNNNYDVTGLSGDTVKGTVGWTNGYVDRVTNYTDRTETATDVTLNINERTDIRHTITPLYLMSKEITDGFRLGFLASLPLTIRSYSSDQWTETHTKTATVYNPGYIPIGAGNTTVTGLSRSYTGANTNNPTETSSFNAALNLGIGASYRLIPDRFTVNAGINAVPANFTHMVTTTTPRLYSTVAESTTVDGAGNLIAQNPTATPNAVTTDSVAVTDTWNAYTGNVCGGFMFYFTPNAALDMSMVIPTDNNFRLDISSVHLLLSVKF